MWFRDEQIEQLQRAFVDMAETLKLSNEVLDMQIDAAKKVLEVHEMAARLREGG